MESRIRKLRESRGLTQNRLAFELGISQQMLSKYERDTTLVKIDVLMKIAQYFNVTTDYILGLSDVKRDIQGQLRMYQDIDQYYDFIEIYKSLDQNNKELMWSILQIVKKNQEIRNV